MQRVFLQTISCNRRSLLTFSVTKETSVIFSLNLMIAGTEDGNVCAYAYGIFPMGMIDLSKQGCGKVSVKHRRFHGAVIAR